jgi:outer membrane protein assembly factor BamD (BamD/ComL family)
MNKLAKKAGFILALITLLIPLFSSCTSTVKITDDMSPAELIQRAQEASDRNRYNIALQYYEALYDRNRSNIDLVITAEYEIAFIHYKQKKYHQSREELNAILAYYNSPDEELLPQHFKRLAQIVLKSIEEKESQRALLQRTESSSESAGS